MVKLFSYDESTYLKLKINYQRNLLRTIGEREYNKFVGLYRDDNGILKFPYLENICALLNVKPKNYSVSELFNSHFKKKITSNDLDNKEIYISGNFLKADHLALYFGLNKKNYIAVEYENEIHIHLMLNSSTNEHLKISGSSPIKSSSQANHMIDIAQKTLWDINMESETIYAIEHSLLMDNANISREDLFAITFIFPSWPTRFQDQTYREISEQAISEHTPAHLHYNILWLDIEEMKIFENTYYRWTNIYANDMISEEETAQAKKNLLGILKMYIMG